MKIMDIIAEAISLILCPPALILYFLIVSARHGLYAVNTVNIIIICLLFLLPILFLIYLFKTKRITDLDMTHRKERYSSLIVMNVFLLILLQFVHIRNLEVFFHYLWIFFIINLITSLITIVYKISFHMTATLIFITFINHIAHNQFLYFYLSVPLIFWSRYVLKRHTAHQLILPFLIDIPILWMMLK